MRDVSQLVVAAYMLITLASLNTSSPAGSVIYVSLFFVVAHLPFFLLVLFDFLRLCEGYKHSASLGVLSYHQLSWQSIQAWRR